MTAQNIIMLYMYQIHNAMRKKYCSTKKGLTLVELVAAMVLTAMFAGACVMLILPVSKIYTNAVDQNRVQLVTDAVVESLRSECSKAIVSDYGDAWIANVDPYEGKVMESAQPSTEGGSVLIFRRNQNYCETIASDYVITNELYNAVYTNDDSEDIYKGSEGVSRGVTSRSIYDMADSDKASGLIHFGYYSCQTSDVSGYAYIYPGDYYDFTNPFTNNTYLGCTVELFFHNMEFFDNGKPASVCCKVTVTDEKGFSYSRDVALCFS